jgi:uncharacterized repeat protein (TIGR04138 family)
MWQQERGCRTRVRMPTSGSALMQNPDFSEIVTLICKEDPRFDRKAYDFVRLGLDHTVKELRKKDTIRAEKSRHVTGPELLDGLRTYALDQFGPLAKTVLNAWGIRRCRDFGDIVFNLIEYNVFSKTENDRREDFTDVFEFDEAFVKPFQPTKRPRGASAAEAFGAA